MAIELSTAGILTKWAVEATAGTRPTTGFATIPGVTAIPDMNPEPNLLQTTPLSETEYHTHIFGLKDIGTVGLTCNYYDDFIDAWDAMMTAYETAKASGKRLWVEFAIPTMDSWYYPVEPAPLGFGGAEVDSVLQTTAYFAVVGAPENAAASS